MNCPICGRELPENTRKCGNCGCRPQRLAGRPKPPKWLGWVAVALVVGIVIGIFLPVELPGAVPGEEEQEQPALRELFLLSNSFNGFSARQLTYHAAGLYSFCASSLVSSSFPPTIYFSYDGQGRFIGFEERPFDEADTATQTASVVYREEERQVEITIMRESLAEILLLKSILFQYDKTGKTITDVLYSTENVKIHYVYEYNEDGRIHTCTQLSTFGSSEETRTVTYYDYGPDGAMISYTVRRDFISETQQYSCETNASGVVTQTDRLLPPGEFTTGSSLTTYNYVRQPISAQMAAQTNLQLCLLDILGYLSYPVVVQTDWQTSIFE